MRGPFSRESSHQPHDSRQRYSESPKKTSSLGSAKRASKGYVPGENKDKETKNDKKEEEDKKTEDDNENNTAGQQLLLPSGQLQEFQKGSSEQSQNSEVPETSTKDQKTGEEIHQHVADSEGVCVTSEGVCGTSEGVCGTSEAVYGTSEAVCVTSEGVCGTSPPQAEEVARDTNDQLKGTSPGAEEKRNLFAASGGDHHVSPRSLEGGSVAEGRLEGEEGAGEEVAASTDARITKDLSHRLSLPLNELIRSVRVVLSIKNITHNRHATNYILIENLNVKK